MKLMRAFRGKFYLKKLYRFFHYDVLSTLENNVIKC